MDNSNDRLWAHTTLEVLDYFFTVLFKTGKYKIFGDFKRQKNGKWQDRDDFQLWFVGSIDWVF